MTSSTTEGAVLASRVLKEHGAAVQRYLRRVTGHPELARDLAQDVYVKVLGAAATYRPQERERAWVFRIARNVFIDHRRRHANTVQGSLEREGPVQQASQLLRVSVTEALSTLDPVDRDCLLLSEIGGLRYEEIANMLEITVAGVRSRIYRTRIALRGVLLAPPAVTPHVARGNDSDDT